MLIRNLAFVKNVARWLHPEPLIKWGRAEAGIATNGGGSKPPGFGKNVLE